MVLFNNTDIMTAKELSKFLKASANEMYKEDNNSTYFQKLDADFGIYVGWNNGFEEDDEYCLHSKSQPSYGVCVKVAEWNPADIDYMWLNMPWSVETGDVWDNEITINENTDYYAVAKDMLKTYRSMRKYLDKGEITFGK